MHTRAHAHTRTYTHTSSFQLVLHTVDTKLTGMETGWQSVGQDDRLSNFFWKEKNIRDKCLPEKERKKRHIIYEVPLMVVLKDMIPYAAAAQNYKAQKEKEE